MEAALILTNESDGFDRFLRHCARYSAMSPRTYPRGVFKFRSLEEAQLAVHATHTALPPEQAEAVRRELLKVLSWPQNRPPEVPAAGGLIPLKTRVEVERVWRPKIEGARTALNPSLALPILRPGWFLTPRLGIRHVSYRLTRTAPGQEETPHADIPWFSADAGLVFERDARFFGEALTQTFEPRLFYVRVPYRDQDDIPIFDTALADFNFPQLFTANRFGGGDRFGDANQATLALTSRFLQPSGQELFRATIGQRYYFEDERVGLTPDTPLRTSAESDVLASIGGRLFRYWSFDATTQYNRLRQRNERYSASVRYSPELGKVLNLSYRFTRDTLRQFDISAQWPLAPGWYAVGRYNYSVLDDRLLEGLAGFEYNAGCWAFRAVVQRLQAATQVSSTGIFFQLEFSGVGRLGTEDVVGLLSRSVPGYSAVNLSDPALVPPGQRPQLPFEQTF